MRGSPTSVIRSFQSPSSPSLLVSSTASLGWSSPDRLSMLTFYVFRMLLNPKKSATEPVDCTYTGDDWHWGYEGVYGAECWGTHVPACNGVKQSPIDIPAKYGGLLPLQESSPLTMSNYAAVRFATFSNTGENYVNFHDEDNGDRVSNGIFKNNGHTAVCIPQLQSDDNYPHSAT